MNRRIWIGRCRTVAAAVVILGLAAAALGQDPRSKKAPGKNDQPDQSRPRALYGITWQPTVEAALKQASSRSAQDATRPVLVLRLLGDLSGFC
jgi:hypothetical protein